MFAVVNPAYLHGLSWLYRLSILVVGERKDGIIRKDALRDLRRMGLKE